MVVLGCRDATDTRDVYLAFDAETGTPRWRVEQPSLGRLDYGSSPRTTPVIAKGKVFVQGAHGLLMALEKSTGQIVWKVDLRIKYATPPLEWGLCATPLLHENKLVALAGGLVARVVALNPENGDLLWKSEGGKPGHASFISLEVAGTPQCIGYDDKNLAGWDLATGKRLWSVTPPTPGDFNVPTPIVLSANRLLAISENNGARIYQFTDQGTLSPEPVAENPDILPDSHTPVVLGDRVYAASNGLHALSTVNLQTIWSIKDRAFRGYVSVLGAGSRLLCLNEKSELLLVEDHGEQGEIIGRVTLPGERPRTLSHPAVAGGRLYVRWGKKLACFDLGGE